MSTKTNECPICMECIDNNSIQGGRSGCITNCGHYFHETCMYTWTYFQKKDHCPYCRTLLDHDLLDHQHALRKLIRMKQRQPTNPKIDDILFRLKTDRKNTLDWFCGKTYTKSLLYSTAKPPRVPEQRPKRKNEKRQRF